MIKRTVILVVLSIILIGLVRFNSTSGVNNTGNHSDGSSKYTKIEYKINNIKGNQYYGKSDNGNEIIFSEENIKSAGKIHIHDVVICYFDKNNLGKGLIKVEKK